MIKDFKGNFTSYNISDFTTGKVNFVYITGFSGSGKTTLAEKLFYKYDVINIELNNIDPENGYIYNKVFSEKNEIFYDFLKQYKDINDKIKGSDRGRYREELFNAFFPFAEKWCQRHKDKKYSIEGIQIYEFPKNINKHSPIIVMNTTAKESADRKYKRDLIYNEYIVSKENVKKLEDFKKSLDQKEKEQKNMVEMSDANNFKILPLSLDLIYKYRDSQTNHLGNCTFGKEHEGLIITTNNGEDLVGYIIIANHKLAKLEVVSKYKNKGLSEKLIKYAIERFGLNEAIILDTKEKMIKMLQKIGFKVISRLDNKVNLKLRSIITRKNNYEDLIVKRETSVNSTTGEEEFIYYFSKDNLTQVARLVLIPSKHYISSLTMYDGFNTQKDLEQILDFATTEKNCTITRLPYGDKEKLAMYEAYGFEVVQKVKNSKGKFYHLELMEKAKFASDKDLMEWLEENVTTTEFIKLMTPVEVERTLKGSSHDQVQFIIEKLPFKYNASPVLVLEKNADDEIIKTHTIATYRKGDKLYWMENAMLDAIGIHGPYNDLDELEADVEKKFDFVNKDKDYLDFIPVYVKFNKPVDLETYINSILTLKEV